MLPCPPAPQASSLQIPTAAEGISEPQGHMSRAVQGHQLPRAPPGRPPPARLASPAGCGLKVTLLRSGDSAESGIPPACWGSAALQSHQP